ncbi:MAG: T9SS type A sorting domain-containing protein [Candidatus Krumholzibacteriota bacterium]|nr:T9SS type A sorting domain-containing protein [Candidatus Krumholzibacteriota bacterium]
MRVLFPCATAALLVSVSSVVVRAGIQIGWAEGGTESGDRCNADCGFENVCVYDTDYYGNLTLSVRWDVYSTDDARVMFKWHCNDSLVAAPDIWECSGSGFDQFSEEVTFHVDRGLDTLRMQIGIYVDNGSGFSCDYSICEKNFYLSRPPCDFEFMCHSLSNKTTEDETFTVSGLVIDMGCGALVTDIPGPPVTITVTPPVGSPYTRWASVNSGHFSKEVSFPGDHVIGTYSVHVWYTPNDPYPHPLKKKTLEDNGSFYRSEFEPIAVNVPPWERYQDNFPSASDMESYVRADMAGTIAPPENNLVVPGDSIVVECVAVDAGALETTLDGRPAIFMNVKCTYAGPGTKPPLYGLELEGTYGSYYSTDGTWTAIQGDSARAGSGPAAPDRYMFDLNDSLFTRGYVIEYYFEAYDTLGGHVVFPPNCDEGEGYFEWTCLPTLASDILYVDDCDGVYDFEQMCMDATFEAVLAPGDLPDRYDVLAPLDRCSNGLSSRARLAHLAAAYRTIVWDSGNLLRQTVSDGVPGIEADNDCALLLDWLEGRETGAGLFVMGAGAATDVSYSPDGEALLQACGVTLVDSSYYELSGGVQAPMLAATPGGIVDVGTFHIQPSFQPRNWFDVIDPDGVIGQPALEYPDLGAGEHCAGVWSTDLNGHGYEMRTMWLGFSLPQIVDVEIDGMLTRNGIMRDVLSWMGHAVKADVTGEDAPPLKSRLAQCFPNPFNPVTTIEFTIRKKGRVRLAIYTVDGRRIRTLVDEVREAGLHRDRWDGLNDAGGEAASGIYFYRLDANGFRGTKKMVLLR